MVVLAGEDRNDRRCLRVLLESFCPDMRGRLIEINEPIRLHKVPSARLPHRVGELARLIKARAARESADIACVFVHEDFDSVDCQEYIGTHRQVQKVLRLEFPNAHYVLAVEEIEAWLLLFPDALAKTVNAWRLPAKYRGKDTGRLRDPKRILMQEVSKQGRRYRESDAPLILEQAAAAGLLRSPTGSNRSWARLCADAQECCSHHIAPDS